MAKKRKDITFPMIKNAYNVRKKIDYEGLTIKEAAEKIHNESGMDKGSAQNYLNNIRCLKIGQEYDMKMKAVDTLYFLSQIYKDDGESIFNNGLIALNNHINYASFELEEKSSVEKLYNNLIDGKINIHDVITYYEEYDIFYSLVPVDKSFESRSKTVFPLEEAYVFLEEKGYGNVHSEVLKLHTYNGKRESTVRRGYIILFMEKKGMLNEFLEKYWPDGKTTGKINMQYCINFYHKVDSIKGIVINDNFVKLYKYSNYLTVASE